MNLTPLFCEVDDFFKNNSLEFDTPQLTDGKPHRNRKGVLSPSEIITLLIWFHQSHGYRNFKGYYTHYVSKYLRSEFPDLVSYQRFVELIPRQLIPLTAYLLSRKGTPTGIAFVDSTSLAVCDNHRIRSHKVFKGIAQRGKTSMGWFFGLKLHLVINDRGELLGFYITPGNVDDRQPVPRMVKGLWGLLCGDRGYISKELFQKLYPQSLQLVTRTKKNMKPRVLGAIEHLLLRKRTIIETINDLLKNCSQIEHSRHRSPLNAMVHLLAGLVAYTWLELKPRIELNPQDVEIMMGMVPGQQFLTL